MSSFPFVNTEPATGTPPRVSQPIIQQNNNSIYNLIAVDHVGFGNTTGGQHNQITIPQYGSLGNPAGVASSVASAAGTASASTAQLFFKNSLFSMLLSSVKAFGIVSGTSVLNGYNVTSSSSGGTGIFNITLSITMPSDNFSVIATSSVVSGGGYPNVTTTYNITGTTTFTIYAQDTKSYVGIAVPSVSFVVLQV